MKRALAASFVIASLFSLPALADSNHGKKEHGAQGASTQSGAMSEGEVRKVDKDAKKITIKHGPLVNLDMPAMTMVFQVQDPALLDKVKPGDKVKFQAEKIGGGFAVTKIEPAK
jgi:Cu(I)/Ag(I) efflux system protein CusF